MTGTFVGTTKFAARGHEKGAGSPAPLIRLYLVDYAGISRTILPILLPSCIRWRADGHIPIRGGTLYDSRKPTRNEQESGSSPLVGSPFFPQASQKAKTCWHKRSRTGSR